MADRRLQTIRQVPKALRGIIRFREQRVYRLYYECLECTGLGSEWMDEALAVGPSWCPCCDRKAEEPYFVEEFEEERPEFAIDG